MPRVLCRLLAVLCPLLCLIGMIGAVPALAQSRGPIVLAAASLQESLNAAADRWAAKGHARPVLSFAGTPALARQIEAGAPADLFVSADSEWMDYLAQRHLIRAGTRVNLLTNSLVLIAPATSPLRLPMIRNLPLLRALGPTGRLAMADPQSVPAGIYGRQALTALGVWPQIAPRVARTENVRAALMLVARGEAPLGVVYATDARVAAAVRVVGVFPPASHAPIVYPVAVPTASRNAEGEQFRRFLLSGEAKALFRSFGFGTR